MKFLNFLIVIIFFFSSSCKSNVEEIYSNIDGLDHGEILKGPESVEKHCLKLIYKIDTTFSDKYFKILVDKLISGPKIWRPYYFNTLSLYCDNVNDENKNLLEVSIFNYFIHNPKEYLEHIKKMNFKNSDCILQNIANYIQQYLKESNITIISMKNVARKYCENCSNEETETLYQYLDLASKYQSE
ncbi:MAG: hypothetical protein P8H35_08945 [Flavobacteriales bacterium]|nr:hypothetical protein [Flavobacteriales bacterium]